MKAGLDHSEEFGSPVPQSGRPHGPSLAENEPSRIWTTVTFIQRIAASLHRAIPQCNVETLFKSRHNLSSTTRYPRSRVRWICRVFLGRATPQSAGGRHNWFVDCVEPTALRRSRQLLFSAASEQVPWPVHPCLASLFGL